MGLCKAGQDKERGAVPVTVHLYPPAWNSPAPIAATALGNLVSGASAFVLFYVDQPRAERTVSGLRAASALENLVLGAGAHSTSSHSSAFVLFCIDQPEGGENFVWAESRALENL